MEKFIGTLSSVFLEYYRHDRGPIFRRVGTTHECTLKNVRKLPVFALM